MQTFGRKGRKILSTGDLGRIKGKSSSREREGVDLIDRPRLVIISRLVHCRFFGTTHAHYCFPNSDPVVDHVHFPIPQLLPPQPLIVLRCWKSCATFRRDPEEREGVNQLRLIERGEVLPNTGQIEKEKKEKTERK